MNPPEIILLGHHKIGPLPPHGWASWYYVPTETFAAQLRWLREHGYAYLDLKTFLNGLDRPETLPAKSVLITFDDGYRSLLHHGLPEMEAVGCPGVVFVPTSYIGKTNTFDDGKEPEEAICSWEELAELEQRGIAVQSHGLTHRPFSTLSPEELDAEIGTSKQRIEQRLARPVELFSFPYGDNTQNPDAVETLLRQHRYRAACLYGGHPQAFPTPNPFRLTRIALGTDTNLAEVLQKRS